MKKDGSVRDIAYWSLPATAADDGEEASALAKRSFDIAKKVAVAKASKPRKPRKSAKPVAKKTAARKPAVKPKAKK